MSRTSLTIVLLLAGALLLGAAGVSVAVYGSVDPCVMLAEERARRARDAAEDRLGSGSGARSPEEAVEEAREVLGRATGEVARAASEAAAEVEGLGPAECAGELWNTWF